MTLWENAPTDPFSAIICACLPSLRPIVRVMLRQPIVVYIRGSKPSSIELKPKSWHSGPLGRSRIAPSDLDNWEPLRDASSNGVGGKAWVPGSSTQAILGLQTVCITADPPSTKGRDRDRDKERGSSDGDSERNIELEEQGRAGIFVRTEMTWQNEWKRTVAGTLVLLFVCWHSSSILFWIADSRVVQGDALHLGERKKT